MKLIANITSYLLKLFRCKNFFVKDKETSLLLWDLENIPTKHYQTVIERLGFTPLKTFVTTKREIGNKEKRFIVKHKLYYEKTTKFENADRALIDYALKRSECYDRFIFLSSDSDFANTIKILLKLDKKVDLFTLHGSNYRILMHLSLDNPNLKIHSLEIQKQPTNTPVIQPMQPIQPKVESKPQKIDRRVIITKRKPLPIIKNCFVCRREYQLNSEFKFPTVCPYCRKLIVERYPFLTNEESSMLYNFKNEYTNSMKRFGYYDINQRKDEPHLVLEDSYGDNFNVIDLKKFLK